MYGDGKHSKGHIEDFKNKHKILKEDLVDHIKMVISKGIVEYSKIRLKNGKPGLEKLHRFNNYYMIAAIGLNGFLVSAYPLEPNEAKKLIKENREWK